MLYIGLDTHLNSSTLCVLNAAGQRQELRTIRGPWSGTAAYLRTIKEPISICYEASCGYGPLHDELKKFCDRVLVAHPGRLRLIFQSRRKSDRVDAEKLAKLLYLEEVPKIHVPSPDVRAWRELIEMRQRRIQGRTRVKNNIRSLMHAYALPAPSHVKILWTRRGREALGQMEWPNPAAKVRMSILLEELDHCDHVLTSLTRELERIAANNDNVALLCTIPGIGPRIAEATVAYLDDVTRFSRINRAGSYVGIVPSQHSSGNTERLGHITKEGPRTLRYLLVEGAWQGIRRDPSIRAYFERICRGDPARRKRALVATAHKLLRCMTAMLKHNQPWAPQALEQAA